MRLKKLKMKNFFSHKDSVIDFDTLGPITLIMGEKESSKRKSNGTGKTSVIEAINFALYEQTRYSSNKNSTLDDMVRWNSDNKMSVELEFEINNILYRIQRARDATKSKGTAEFDVFKNGKWTSLTGEKKKETNKIIVEHIGIDYETFLASICFQSKEVDQFVSATEQERKAIIKNILNLDKYEQHKVNAKVKLVGIESDLKVIELRLESIGCNILDVDVKEALIKDLDKKINLCEIEKRAIESQLEKLRKQQILFNDKVESISSFKRQIKEKADMVDKLQLSIDSSTKKIVQYQKVYDDKKVDLDRFKEKLEGIKEQFVITKEEILKEGKTADKRVKQSEIDYEEVSKVYHQASGDIKRIEKDIESIKKLEIARCPTCFSGIDQQSKQSSINFLEAHRPILDDKLKAAEVQHQQIKTQLEIHKQQLEAVKSKLEQYSKWIKEKLHLQDTIKLVSESVVEAEMIIKDSISIVFENQTIVTQYSKDLIQLRQDLGEINIDTDGFNQLNTSINKKSSELKETSEILMGMQLEKGKAKQQIDFINKTLEEGKLLKSQRENLAKEKFYYDYLVKLFGKEIPTLIIENTCNELSEEANKVLKQTSDDQIEFVTQRPNKDGTLKEVFEIEVIRSGIGKPVLMDSLSNGQKFRVVFAIRIALSRLLARRRGLTNIEFLFYDECFGALDEQGIDDVIGVFNYLKQEFAHQLIITHRSDLKDYFDNNILTVSMNKDKVSSIK